MAIETSKIKTTKGTVAAKIVANKIIVTKNAFTPLSLPNLVYWHDISDLSTMWQDSAKTTPVTATGQTVGYIEDKTGNGHDVHQTTAGNRPILRIVGGLYKLEYDGATSNRWLESVNTINLTGTNAVSVCAAVTVNNDHLGVIAETSSAYFSNNGTFLLFYSTNRYAQGIKGDGTARGISSAVLTAPNTRVVVGAGTIGGTYSVRQNQAETSASLSTGAGNYGNYTLYLGRRASSSLPFDGDIYQSFLTSDILTGTNLANSEAFLAEKSGVTL